MACEGKYFIMSRENDDQRYLLPMILLYGEGSDLFMYMFYKHYLGGGLAIRE